MEGTMSDTTTQDQATAAPGELDLGIGVVAPPGTPRPDLDGLLVMLPRAKTGLYLILDGYLRGIPNPETRDKLFRADRHEHEDLNIYDIPEGEPISNGARLARPSAEGKVYLVSNSKKRWVTSPAAMDRYQFDPRKAPVTSEPDLLLLLPDGPNINAS
jgi:hypothetical protein